MQQDQIINIVPSQVKRYCKTKVYNIWKQTARMHVWVRNELLVRKVHPLLACMQHIYINIESSTLQSLKQRCAALYNQNLVPSVVISNSNLTNLTALFNAPIYRAYHSAAHIKRKNLRNQT